MFIEFERSDGIKVHLNSRHITKVMPVGDSGQTWIHLIDGTKESVKKPYYEVCQIMVNVVDNK
jgi:uncharacterized protein YlzI (FlbEa/FlbD family)